MSEKKRKFDEQTLARVLEAAYVLQEHQHELEDFKSSLELKRRAPANDAERALAAAAPPAPPIAFPAPPVSPSDVPVPGASTSPLPFPSPASPMPIASAPLASPAPLTILPAPEPVVAESYDSIPVQMDSIPAQIVETEAHVQGQNLDLDAAMALVVGQVIEICGAAGAAIGIVNRRMVVYRSVAGIRTLPAESEVSMDDALCAPCLQNGEIWRCADTTSERPEYREECRHRGIGSLIAAPVFHEGRTVGALELLFSDPAAFTEHDVQTCQMMAGVITESLARDSGSPWKDAPAAKPAPAAETDSAGDGAKENAEEEAEAETKESYGCYRCGHKLLADEQFCGKCGTPRAGDYEPASMQSKVASLWHMQETKKPEPTPPVQLNEFPAELGGDAAQVRPRASILNLNPTDRSKRTSVPHFGLHDAETNNGTEQPAAAASIEKPETKRVSEIDAPAVRTDKALEVLLAPASPVRADWSSASSARDFLEQVADGAPQNVLLRLWNTRRGDIYLAVAVILVLCVLRWGMWPNHPASPHPSAPPAATAPRKTAEVELPFSERMLIGMGLAEAPEPPADKGNPSTQVWVDLHTALYYCPGADLYGKTAAGKYTTQREAELDQFQPAYRKTCN